MPKYTLIFTAFVSFYIHVKKFIDNVYVITYSIL